jgi:hypothetical protein
MLGCAVSPNSRYLYVTDQQHILQYDLAASNIFTSVDTIMTNNAYPDIGGHSTVFFSIALAPNGKIYIMSVTTNQFLGIINAPNERGIACNAVQQAFFVPIIHSASFPNYPNFRLGPVDGSVCDSLGIDNVVVTETVKPSQKEGQVKVYPNLTTGALTLTHAAGTTLKSYTIADISGKIIVQNAGIPSDNTLHLDLPNGVYFLIVNDVNGVTTRHKVVVIR